MEEIKRFVLPPRQEEKSLFKQLEGEGRIVSDTGLVPEEGASIAFEMVPYSGEKEPSILGDEMMTQAAAQIPGNERLGLAHAEEMRDRFNEHPELIPQEMKESRIYLIFAGTVERGSGGNQHVAYLYWGCGRCCLNFGWLGSRFQSNGRLARLCKQ